MKQIKRSQGFTLIEILVALLILAMVMTTALTGLSAFANHLSRIKIRFIGSQVAQYQLSTLRVNDAWPSVGRDETDLDYANENWRVVQNTSQTDVAILRRVDVEVYGLDNQLIFTATGFLAEPINKTGVPATW